MRVAGHDLDVFGADFVGFRQHFIVVVADDHLAVIAPRLPGNRRRGQNGKLAFHFVHGGLRQVFGIRQQDRGRVGAVLGLAEKVGRAQFAVHRIVGDDQGFRGTGQKVDPHLPEKLPLRLGHEGVAGPDDHVHGRNRAGSQSHRADRLDPAQAVDFIGAGQVQGRHDRRIGSALKRRRGGDHALHSRHPGRDHAHVRGGHQRILAAGHVAADATDGNVAVPQHHAGAGFDFHIVQRCKLDPCKVADLLLGEADVGDVPRVQAAVAVVDLLAAQAECVRRPAVELLRVSAHGLVAVLRDVAQYALDRRLDARVALTLLSGGHALLYVSNHCFALNLTPAPGCFTPPLAGRRINPSLELGGDVPVADTPGKRGCEATHNSVWAIRVWA